MKINIFVLIIFLIGSVPVWGQISKGSSYITVLPLFDKENIVGEIEVEIQDEKLVSIDKSSLIKGLRSYLQDDTIARFEALSSRINPNTLPIPIKFNPAELRLEIILDVEMRKREDVAIHDDFHHRFENEALRPATFGGAINSRLEQNWTNSPLEEKYFSGQFDTFLNLNTVVLENQSFYQSTNENKWFRGDSRIVKDIEKKQIRVQVGDVHPLIQGFMVGRPIGGINVTRNFSLNPYRLPYPTGEQNFALQSRSLVKYFVNGSLIKSEYLPAGNYTAKDIPLNNGLNTVVIEAVDDLGQRKVFVFKSAASINLLNRGESRFDLSYGRPFLDQNLERKYVSEDGDFFSGFYQYGFSSSFSSSLYSQTQKEHLLAGTELIHATSVGNLGAGVAGSKRSDLKGNAQSLSYQFLGSGKQWYFSQSIGLRYEMRSEKFRTNLIDSSSAIKNNYSGNIALPLSSKLTLAFGANYGDVRDNNLNDRYGFDSTINLKILDRHNLSIFIGRTKDEYKTWNDVAYLFLTITFPESNDFISTFYDQRQKDSKLTYTHDNQNRLYSPKAQAILQNNSNLQLGESDVILPTPFADFGGRVSATHLIDQDKIYGRGSLRVNSALAFAQNDGEWGFGVSRPIASSFVLFKPEKRLQNQKVALKSTSPYTEAQTGLFNEITFSNLLAYQYREIQLDPTMLDEGRSLKKEKFILFPTYRSAHLIKLEDKGAVIVKGTLSHRKGAPHTLKIGHFGDKIFFTNREGEFFVEGIEAGTYKLKLDDFENEIRVNVLDNERGMKDLGTLIIEEQND